MQLRSSSVALIMVGLLGVAAVGDSGPLPPAVATPTHCVAQAAGECAHPSSRWQSGDVEIRQIVAARTTSVLADFPDQ